MEDAATAEISRAQLWQWIRHRARLGDGRTVDLALCEGVIDEELVNIRQAVGDPRFQAGRFADAAALMRQLIAAPRFPEFLTLPAYDLIAPM